VDVVLVVVVKAAQVRVELVTPLRGVGSSVDCSFTPISSASPKKFGKFDGGLIEIPAPVKMTRRPSSYAVRSGSGILMPPSNILGDTSGMRRLWMGPLRSGG